MPWSAEIVFGTPSAANRQPKSIMPSGNFSQSYAIFLQVSVVFDRCMAFFAHKSEHVQYILRLLQTDSAALGGYA